MPGVPPCAISTLNIQPCNQSWHHFARHLPVVRGDGSLSPGGSDRTNRSRSISESSIARTSVISSCWIWVDAQQSWRHAILLLWHSTDNGTDEEVDQCARRDTRSTHGRYILVR